MTPRPPPVQLSTPVSMPRPFGSTAPINESTPSACCTFPETRRRGRPKGATNKPQIPPTFTNTAEKLHISEFEQGKHGTTVCTSSSTISGLFTVTPDVALGPTKIGRKRYTTQKVAENIISNLFSQSQQEQKAAKRNLRE